MSNRRECVRCELLGIPLGPNVQGETLNVSGCANGKAVWGTLAWRRADWTLRTFRFRGTPKT